MQRFKLVILALIGLAVPASAQDDYRHGRIRYLEPQVTLQRATETGAEEAVVNLPYLPGDRVWTDAGGRVEFQFESGALLRLDSRSKLDYTAHDEGRDGRVVLRLWSGGLYLRVRNHGDEGFVFETPGGLVEIEKRGVYRIDADSGEVRLSVYEGEAKLEAGGERVDVDAGERAYARRGESVEPPTRFDRGEDDEFARWDEDRERREAWAAGSRKYLPDELDPYASEFESNGTWYYEGDVGYVWRPTVAVGMASVLERPLGLDRVRLDMDALRAVGLGALPLRAMGLLDRARVVLDARAHVGAGLGELGGGRRLRWLVSARLSRPSGVLVAGSRARLRRPAGPGGKAFVGVGVREARGRGRPRRGRAPRGPAAREPGRCPRGGVPALPPLPRRARAQERAGRARGRGAPCVARQADARGTAFPSSAPTARPPSPIRGAPGDAQLCEDPTRDDRPPGESAGTRAPRDAEATDRGGDRPTDARSPRSGSDSPGAVPRQGSPRPPRDSSARPDPDTRSERDREVLRPLFQPLSEPRNRGEQSRPRDEGRPRDDGSQREGARPRDDGRARDGGGGSAGGGGRAREAAPPPERERRPPPKTAPPPPPPPRQERADPPPRQDNSRSSSPSRSPEQAHARRGRNSEDDGREDAVS